MKPEFYIAIPSHNRADSIASKSLAVLEWWGFPVERVKIFVTPGQEAIYRKRLPAKWADQVRTGAAGLAPNRRAIHRAYPEGVNLLQMDDDIIKFIGSQGQETKSKRRDVMPDEVTRHCNESFAMSRLLGAELWGFHPVDNPMMLDRCYRLGWFYICGAFWGCVNTHREDMMVTMAPKEDWHRTLLWVRRDGMVLRNTWLNAKTNYFGTPGGLHADGQEARAARAKVNMEQLLADFPGMLRMNTRKKYEDITFINRPKTIRFDLNTKT